MSAAVYFSLFLSAVTTAALAQDAQQEPPHAKDPWTICTNCGGPYGDERLALHATVEEESGGSVPLVRVVLENTGKRDTMVVLGDMLDNGARQSPDSLRLVVTTEAGEKRILLPIAGFSSVAESMIYLVPLASGAVYSFTIPLSNFTTDPSSDRLDLTALKKPLSRRHRLGSGTGPVHSLFLGLPHLDRSTSFQ